MSKIIGDLLAPTHKQFSTEVASGVPHRPGLFDAFLLTEVEKKFRANTLRDPRPHSATA